MSPQYIQLKKKKINCEISKISGSTIFKAILSEMCCLKLDDLIDVGLTVCVIVSKTKPHFKQCFFLMVTNSEENEINQRTYFPKHLPFKKHTLLQQF